METSSLCSLPGKRTPVVMRFMMETLSGLMLTSAKFVIYAFPILITLCVFRLMRCIREYPFAWDGRIIRIFLTKLLITLLKIRNGSLKDTLVMKTILLTFQIGRASCRDRVL